MKLIYYLLILFLLGTCSRFEIKEELLEKKEVNIVEIYPTSDSLPENLLRFYVQFSHPMKAVNNLEHIKLVNEKGIVIEGAIFNNVYELWDEEQKQLTLLLDPARVKTGLAANEKMGRALKAGSHYQLIIERAEDIYGNILKEPFVKAFFVLPEDQESPNVEQWTIIPPTSGSTTAFQILFPQTLDRLSVMNRIQLITKDNEWVKGEVTITNEEREWRFSPKEKWKKGNYTLLVNSRLEDPSGNNLNGLFDHPIGSLKNKKEGKVLEYEFIVE